jgi:hypothetical protein
MYEGNMGDWNIMEMKDKRQLLTVGIKTNKEVYLCLWFFFATWSLSLRPASINWLSVLGKGGGGILGSATNGCLGMWFVQEPLLPQSTKIKKKKNRKTCITDVKKENSTYQGKKLLQL